MTAAAPVISLARARHLRASMTVTYAYRVHTAARDACLRELAEYEWLLAGVALEACRHAPSEARLTPYLVAQSHRRLAKQYLRRVRGEEI